MENRKKIAVLFSGKGSNFAHIVKTLHKKEIDVVLALTNNPNAQGIEIAKAAGIPLEVIDSKKYISREAFDRVVVECLKKYAPDLTILAGFMRILTPVFTDTITSINLHPSLLPRHKGLHAIEKSYNDSFPIGGVSVHYVSSELDGGEIVLQKEISKKGLDFESYDTKIRTLEKEALVEAIKTVLLSDKG
ncbi:MAG TPA: phosphoribosylglycinamide formyltransferase [Sulfurovum sp.]|nr:phosphoribosylglycinamide formyltransferase [Sulfurovum sp.]